MSRTLPIALACALAAVVALAAPVSAQKSGDTEKSPRQKLRERVIALRTEVDVLRLEHDADRDDLYESLRTVHRLRREGLAWHELVAIREVMKSFRLAIRASNQPDAERVYRELLLQTTTGKANRQLERYVQEKGLMGVDENELARLVIEGEVKARIETGQAAVAEKTARFAETARRLHEKSLDLEDAERRYRETR